VRIGALEVWPATELAVIVAFAGLLGLLLRDTPEGAQTALRLTVFGYLVWTAVASFCDFQSEAQRQRGEIPGRCRAGWPWPVRPSTA
jgi:threonine/homoserine/homoserine lactone efflux protein